MSDLEEPPSKLSKFSGDMEHNISIGSAENGQEEWLSEEVMTDDDYNPMSQTMQEQELALEQSSQDGSQPSTTDSMEVEQLDDTGITDEHYGHETSDHELQTEHGLEATGLELDNGIVPLQETDNGDQTEVLYQVVQELPANHDGRANAGAAKPEAAMSLSQLEDDIGMFLIRKPPGAAGGEAGAEGRAGAGAESPRRGDREEDDGNNTDDLLNMLGEGASRPAPAQPRTHAAPAPPRTHAAPAQPRVHAAPPAAARATDDHGNMFGNTTITTQKVAKNTRLNKLPVKKAVPEESDSDMSSDEAAVVQQMFRVTRKKTAKQNPTKTPSQSSAGSAETKNRLISLLKTNQPMRTYGRKGTTPNASLNKSGVQNKPLVTNIAIKTAAPKPTSSSTPFKQNVNKKLSTPAFKQTPTEKTSERRPSDDPPKQPSFASAHQRLMRPEDMDDEVPTDDDSNMSDGSFYDELPSSESEDIEDWFALDIRAERAGDYVPLLGHKACALLRDEKGRVADKLRSLRSGLSTLSEQSRAQTQQIGDARRTLAELDAQLTHA